MLSQDVCCGSWSGKSFINLRHSFDLLLVTSSKSIWCFAKTSGGGTLSALFWCLCQKSSLSLFTLIKLLPHKAVSDWSCVFGPKATFSPSEITNPTLFTISNQPWKSSLPEDVFLMGSWVLERSCRERIQKELQMKLQSSELLEMPWWCHHHRLQGWVGSLKEREEGKIQDVAKIWGSEWGTYWQTRRLQVSHTY